MPICSTPLSSFSHPLTQTWLMHGGNGTKTQTLKWPRAPKCHRSVLSLGCSDTSQHLPTSTLGWDTVYCQENLCRDLKSRYLVTRTVPQNLLAGGTFVTTGPGRLEVQISHSIAFVGDNFLSHFASLSHPSQLPTKGHPENIVALWRTWDQHSTAPVHRSSQISTLFASVFPASSANNSCLQVLFIWLLVFWDFRMHLGPICQSFSTARCLDTLLLILPKWNLSFSHYHMNMESRALTKILNVMRCYEIARASTTVPKHIHLINRWV